MISWWVWWPSLSHSTAYTGSNTWQCCWYLFFSVPRFSCFGDGANPSSYCNNHFATSSFNPVDLLYTQGRPYTPPSISSVTWTVLSYCVFFLFHILVLQPVAFALHVNLDFVLCPAPRWSKDFFLLIIFGRCNDILKRHRNMFVSELCSIFFLHFNLSLCMQWPILWTLLPTAPCLEPGL